MIPSVEQIMWFLNLSQCLPSSRTGLSEPVPHKRIQWYIVKAGRDLRTSLSTLDRTWSLDTFHPVTFPFSGETQLLPCVKLAVKGKSKSTLPSLGVPRQHVRRRPCAQCRESSASQAHILSSVHGCLWLWHLVCRTDNTKDVCTYSAVWCLWTFIRLDFTKLDWPFIIEFL